MPYGFCPLHNGLQVIRHAYPLFVWRENGARRWRRVFRHAERALSVGGTVLMMWRNGAFRVMRKAFSLGGRAFSGWNDGCDGEAGGIVLMCGFV